jgi:outer membrane lipoprotein-sorting protein
MSPQSTNPFDNEAPDDVLERAIASHHAETVPPGPPSRLVAATLRALNESEQSPRSLLLTPRTPMKRYLTTAAGLLLAIAACTMFGVLLRTPSTAAFAHMIEPILRAKTARFNITIELKDLPKQTARMMISGAGHMRQEMPTGQIHIIDSDVGKSVMVTPADKSAVSFNMAVLPEQQRPTNYFDLLRTGLRSAEGDQAAARESLGKKQVDGRDVVGYRVKLKESNGELTIWGDPVTGLPIVAEMKLAMFPDGRFTMTDFEFDVELDEELFDTQVPNGYTLVEHTISMPTEADLIAGLKLVAEHNEGRFPGIFDNSAIGPLISDFVKKNPGKTDTAWKEKVVQLILPFTQGLAFAVSLPAESNARYAGYEVKLGDAVAAIFWYKPAGATAYRVIHGDLMVKEQNDAPESPNAVPVTFTLSIGKMTSDIMKRFPPPVAREPAPPTEPNLQSRPDDPAARQTLDQTVKAYADCKSYRDTGVATTVYHMETGSTRTTERPFATAFVRPDQFRFEFNDHNNLVKDPLGDRLSRYIIWSDGKEVRTWWDVKPGIEKPESLSFALGAAFGVSGGTSSTIAGLLMPDQTSGGKLQLIKFSMGFTLGEEGQLGAHACYRVIGAWGKFPMTVWIDKQSHLVRRIDTQMQPNNVRIEETTTYDPVVDADIADDLLKFDSPEQK